MGEILLCVGLEDSGLALVFVHEIFGMFTNTQIVLQLTRSAVEGYVNLAVHTCSSGIISSRAVTINRQHFKKLQNIRRSERSARTLTSRSFG